MLPKYVSKKKSTLPAASKHVLMSKVRLDRLKKLEKDLQTNAVRDTLPELTRDEIRRYRLPYYQAVLEELNEKGFTNSEEYLSQLMIWQEQFREEHQYEISVMARPLLRESPEILNILQNGLSSAETAHFQKNVGGEIDEFLLLGIRFGFSNNSDWFWLADHLFTQCINLSNEYGEDGGFRNAEVKYIYGKYLVEQGITDEGVEVLTEASNLSKGMSWCATKILKKLQKSIFIEVSTLLYEVLVQQSKQILLTNPSLALELCYMAKQRAYDACLPRADIMLLLGKCEIENSLPERAVLSFQKAHLLYKSTGMAEKNCEACICLALAYLDLGKWQKSYEELEKLLEYAIKHKLPLYIGKTYLYIGQYHLNQGTPERATPYLVKALNIFHEINDISNREFVKNLAAVSKSQELIEKYVELILRCEDKKKSGENILRLLNWKDTRFPFWEDMSDSSKTDFGSEMTFADETFGEDYQDQQFIVEYDDFQELNDAVHNVSESIGANSEDNEEFNQTEQ